MNETTIILPSSRAIRHELFKIDNETLFLPNFITMGEFISKLCVVKDFKPIDEDTRILLLLKASEFKSFESLQIQRNFFTFTKNSSYIFKFFEELANEKYEIDNLATNDIYAEFTEHIEILQELYKRYEKLCLEQKILDKIFLPKLYKFNEIYAASHKNIEIYVDGHLTNFEFELLAKSKEFCEINIVFKTSRFNTKMQTKFFDLGIELEQNYNYLISLNKNEIVQKEKIIQNSNISCFSFSEQLLQVAFIKQKVYEYIKKGYKAQNIAVILPDEKFATILRTFDEKSNFNFAMGEPFTQTKLYEKLNATSMEIEQDSKENKARLQRVGDEFYKSLIEIYYKNVSEVNLLEFLSSYKESSSDKEANKIYEEELYSFKKVLKFMSEMTVKSALSVFMQRLSSRTLDDIRGGKITVMGVLETRSVEFDAVIIVDFSDSNVPKRSDKDMFLNTTIREMANLPTKNDRENLQKHYYEMLINSSKEVAISFVKSSESSESRFLKQLYIKEQNMYDESEYTKILFERTSLHTKRVDEEIFGTYDFKHKPISASKLKTYLTCKRKFYFKYVEHLEGHIIPKDMPEEYEIGNAVHLALKEVYENQNAYTNFSELLRDIENELDEACGDSELDKYLISLQKRKMIEFAQNEVKRFGDGWHVEMCEKSLKVDMFGVTLSGQIDRIDKRGDEIYVLDYKTGSYPIYNKNSFTDATDFQLEFYYLLASEFGDNIACGYYDLKENKIVPEAFLEEKLAILESNIKDIVAQETINFELCEDIKNCLFCDYKIMCGRD